MPGNDRSVVVRFVGDYKSLGDGADKVTGRLQTVATSLKGIATAGAAVAAGAFLKDAISQASDLQEATSKTGVIFGKSAGEIIRYSEGAAEAIGQSKTEAMAAASTFATFGKSAGLTGKDLTGFSTELVSLSSDLASFHNATPEETVEALGAALRGEAEPMQRFGVLLNDATLREEALAQGLIKTTNEALTPQQKVLAAHGVVMKQTTDAQGDFKRTADGLANSQRTLAATTKDSAAELGQKFLPITQKVTQTLAEGVVPAVTSAGNAVANVLVPVFDTAWTAGSKLVDMWSDLPDPVQNAAVAMGAWALVGQRVTGMLSPLGAGAKGLGEDIRTAMGAFDVGRVTGTFMALEERVPVLGQMGKAFRTAKGEAVGFGGALKGLGAGGLAGAKAAVSGLVGVLGGPWGIAIAGATALLTVFATSSNKAEERQRDLADAGREVARAIAEQGGVLNAASREAAAKLAEDKNLLKQADALGISLPRVTDAILGQKGAYEGLNNELNIRLQQLSEEQDAVSGPSAKGNVERQAQLRGEMGELVQLQRDLQAVVGGRDSEVAALRRQAAAQREEAASKDGVAGAASRAKHSEETWQAVLAESGAQYDQNKTRLENLIAAIEQYNNQAIMSTDSEEAWYAALDQLDAAILENGATLDIRTQKGRDNRDAIEQAAAQSKDYALKQIQEGVAVKDALKAHDNRIAALRTETTKTFGANSAAKDLITTYGAIPKNVVMEFQTKGYDQVWAKLQSLSAGQILGAKSMPLTPANVRAVQKDLKMGRYATGGAVIGFGTGTSDSNLALLSNNEHVWTAREVQAAGGHGAVEAIRAAVLGGKLLPAFAMGGAVTWPQKIDVSKFKIPDPYAAALAAASRGGIGGGVTRWAPLVLQVLRLLGESTALLPNVLRRMNQESGGNPRAINLWDSNARRGTPSIGLMQTIGPTFNAYAGPFRSRGIYDPLANIYAGLNYARTRYPSLQYAMDKPGGYRDGGWLKPGQVGVNETSRPEPVLSSKQWDDIGGLVDSVRALVAKLDGNPSKVINVGGIHVTNRPVDVMAQIHHAEIMAGL